MAIICVASLIYLILTWMIKDRYYQLMFTIVPIWALVGVAWNIFSGYSGLLSFGHAAFFGIGAYTVALLLVFFNISPWFGLIASGFAGAISGVLIGWPTFRLRGHYFALAMLAFPLALLYIFDWLGFQEVTLPMKREEPLLYMQFEDQRLYIVVAMVMLISALLINLALAKSRFGMALLAIKQNEAAAMASGINPLPWKFAAIAISGAFVVSLGANDLTEPVIGLLIGGIVAAPAGAWLTKHIPPRPLMVLVGTVLVLSSLFGIYTALS